MDTYRVKPKSSGLRISYVLGLLRIALAWMPALCVKAQYPLRIRWTLFKAKAKNLRDGVHERDVDLYGFGYQVLDLTQHREIVLALDIFRVGGVQAGDQTAQGSNPDSLADTQYSCRCFN